MAQKVPAANRRDDHPPGLARLRFALESHPQSQRFARSRYDAQANELRLGSPELRWGSLAIADGPGAAALGCAALTVIQASFQQVPVLLADQAAKELGLKKGALPQGFYVLSQGKVAGALFASLDSFEDSPASDACEAFAALAAAAPQLVLEGAFCSDMRFDLDRLLASPSRFAQALMLDAPAAQAFETFGFGARSRILGPDGSWGRPWRGYPAFAQLGSSPMARSGTSAHGEIELASCAGLPIYNHCGHSLINNVRELGVASERKARRQDIFDSMFERWVQLRLAASDAPADASGEPWEPSPKERRQALDKSLAALSSPVIGGERQLVCHPEKTSMFLGSQTLIGSLDWALVDGQHSSVDYALLASAVAAGPRDAPESWLGHGMDAKDAAPLALRRRFAALIKARGRAGAQAIGGGDKSKDAELWRDFSEFFARAKTPLRISFEANPANQLQAIKEANNRRPQRPEAMALLARKSEISQFIELANEEALRTADPVLVAQTKNLSTNPAFAGSASDNAIEFESLFPALYAVCRPVDHRAGSNVSTWFGPHEPENALRQNLAKALGLRSNSSLLADLEERAAALLDALSQAQPREHRLSEKTLSALFGSEERSGILDDIAAQAVGARRVGAAASNRGAFAEETAALRESNTPLAAFSAQAAGAARLISLGGAESGLGRGARAKLAYAMRSRALKLRQTIDQGLRRVGGQALQDDVAEAFMLGVSRRQERRGFGGPESQAAQKMELAFSRVADLSKSGSLGNGVHLAGAFDELRSLAKAASFEGAKPLDFCSMDPQALALLLDATPVGTQGLSLAGVLKARGAKAPPKARSRSGR